MVWQNRIGSANDADALDAQQTIVATAVARADGNLSAAARMLGTTRQTLRYRVKKYGIRAGDE